MSEKYRAIAVEHVFTLTHTARFYFKPNDPLRPSTLALYSRDLEVECVHGRRL